MATKFPKPGEMFEGIYKIERVLGAGGFARIYKGVEAGIGRHVALKVLRPPVRVDQTDTQRDQYLKTVTERFQREAVMLSKLKSPHTVTMFSYGQAASGLLYMVLEFIDGQTLTELRRSKERVAAARIVKILRQVLISLKEAHAMGMLHRDLKPGNIMIYEHLGVHDEIKLLDFGIAKMIGDATKDSTTEDLTSDGTLIGTPRYMAPEQIQGKPVGPFSDLYALGLVAYELCVGERAVEGDSSIQIIGQQLTPESFKLPDSADIPDRLRAIINKMMEKSTLRRYNNASEILQDLEHPELLAILNGEMPSIEMALAELTTSTSEIAIFGNDEPKKPSTSPKLLIGAIFVACLLAVGAGFWFMSNSNPKVEVIAEKEVVAKKVHISIIAKANGQLVPAVITVNGVDKGWTPLKMESVEIENSTIVAAYTDPASKEKLLSRQEVKTPRDLTFEFEPHVARVDTGDIVIETGDIIIEEEVETAVEKKPRTKRRTKRKAKTTKVVTKPKEVKKSGVAKKEVVDKPIRKRSLMETNVAKKKTKETQKKSLLGL